MKWKFLKKYIIIIVISNNLFVSSIFTMALWAVEKTIKMNKSGKIHQYITVNTGSITTKIVKGVKLDS